MVAEIKGRLSLDGKPFIDTLKDVGNKIEKDFSKQLTDIGKKIGAAFAIREVVQFANAAINLGDEIDNLSQQVDMGYESVQSLQLISKDAGVSFDTLRPTINQLRRAIDQARDGNTQFAEAFGAVGLSIEDLRSMNTEQIFQAVSTAIADADGNANVMTASTKILGAESTRLLGVIKQVGSEGLDQLNAKFRESNEILSSDTVRALDAAEYKYRVFTTQIKNAFVGAVAAVGDFVSIITTGDVLSTEQSQQALTELEQKLKDVASEQEQAYRDLQTAIDELTGKQGDLTKAQEDYNKKVAAAEDKHKTNLDRMREIEQKQGEINALVTANEQTEKDVAQRIQEIADAKKRQAEDAQSVVNLEREINNIAQQILEKEQDRDRIKKAFGDDAYGIEDLEQEILDLYVEQSKKISEQEDLKKKTAQAGVDIAKAEKDLAAEQGKVIDNQIAIIGKQGEILKAEGEIAKETGKTNDNKKTAKEIDEERLELLRAQYSRELGINGETERAKQLKGDIKDLEEKLGLATKSTSDLIQDRLNKRNEEKTKAQEIVDTINAMLQAERDANGESERAVQLANMLESAKQDLARVSDTNKQKQDEITSASVEQLEAVEKLREIFKVMTEQELDDFVQKLKDIAKELSQIDEVPNLDWLDKLSNLSLAGLNETRANNVRDFLKALVEGINNLPPIKQDAFNFLEALDELNVSGLNRTRGENVKDFLVAIINGVNQTNTDKLAELAALLQIIDQLGLSGTNTNIAISLPADFQGIPLVFSPEANTTLQSIDTSLQTLAQLRGVVWA